MVIGFWNLNAQSILNGKIKTVNSNDSLAGISVIVKGTTIGTTTTAGGNFQLSVPSLPAALIITSVGFQPVEIVVQSKEAGIILLDPVVIPGQEIIIATNRFPTRLLEAPVSIERYGSRQILDAPTVSYNDLALYKKGVDMTTSSLTFKTISTRGFNGSGSTRVNQLVDGMDNQAPGLNFFIGNFVGLTELDVDNVEILPGASSALYGPGGINGTVLINSKNPFQYQGLSILLKEGVSNVDKSQRTNATSFHDFTLRYAKAFKNKFAFKIGAQYIRATDWLASDTSNYARLGDAGKLIAGNRNTDANYDGVNVYGDETSVDIYPFLAALGGTGTVLEHIDVSRTGYNEKDVIDPETKNIKLSGALHYKITPNTEAMLMGYWATGNTVYTGNNRYALKGIKIGQYKIEIKNPNWFLRSYTTQEDAGKAYSATIATQVANELWKPSFNPANIAASWYPQFTGAYLQARGMGAGKATALQMARTYADGGRPLPGSAQFKQLFDKAASMPIPNGGLFLENSQLWMTEGQYNFSKIKFVNLIVGGNWKKYVLNSEGTLFIDKPGQPIMFNEYGMYGQLTKKLLNNKLTISFSGRYDKNEDFKGRFTPRATALIHVAKDHNIRLSYQTAYRFPSTQQKYIMLDVGDYSILGGLPWILDTMNVKSSPLVDAATGKPYTYNELKPESCRSFELGYKGMFDKKLLLDVYAYFGRYTDFLGRQTLFQPGTGDVYSIVANSTTKVKTHGFGIGFDYLINKNYSAFLNAYSDVITDVPTGFRSYFNAPKYRTNVGFAAHDLGKKKSFGFNVMARWQDAFMWDGELANGSVKAITTVDAQVSYKIPFIRTVIKLGGTNVFNKYYKNAYANPEIGGLYYMSLGFDLK